MSRVLFGILFILVSQVGCAPREEGHALVKSRLVSASAYRAEKAPKSLKLPKKRGDYTLASVFGDANEISWAKRFRIVELGNVESEDVTKELLEEKGIFEIEYPIAYDWMPATYYYVEGENRPFVRWLYQNREETTLNPNGPYIHCLTNGYDWCEEYYFNLANEEVMRKRVEDLLGNMHSRGFAGLFFDWASGGYIEEEEYTPIRESFERLHAPKSYFEYVADFYRRLHKAGVFVVTNQGFRKAEYVLPHVRYDMTESYITTDTEKKMQIEIVGRGRVESVAVTDYYPIREDSSKIEDSLEYIDLLTKYKKRYAGFGFENFIYLDYLAPDYERVYPGRALYKEVKPKNGIYFSYAMAKLTDNMVYAEVTQNRELERDEIYFYDLGKALGESYEKIDALDGYIRFYEKGFVLVVEAHARELFLQLDSKYLRKDLKIYDPYEAKILRSNRDGVVVDLKFHKDPFTRGALPLGRVYLYF